MVYVALAPSVDAVLVPALTTAMELLQDLATGSGPSPATVVTVVLVSVVVSPAMAAQKSQVTTAATVYQEGCFFSHDGRNLHEWSPVHVVEYIAAASAVIHAALHCACELRNSV